MVIRSTAKIRLATALMFATVVGLFAAAALNAALLACQLFGVDLKISAFGTVLFEDLQSLGARDRSFYYACNTAILSMFALTGIFIHRVIGLAYSTQRNYEKITRTVLAIVFLIAAAESIRAFVGIVLLRTGLSPSNYVAFASISCLALLAYILRRSTGTKKYYDRSV